MRRIVRYCANHYRNGEQVELADGFPGVVLVVDKYGALTDLCDECQKVLLDPLLELMSSGEDLNEALTRADWAHIGSVMPSTTTRRRRGKAPAVSSRARVAPSDEPGMHTATLAAASHTPAPPPAERQTGVQVAAPEPSTVTGSPAEQSAKHVCTWCGQDFTRAESLKKHLETFGEKPHERPQRRGAARGRLSAAHAEPSADNTAEALE